MDDLKSLFIALCIKEILNQYLGLVHISLVAKKQDWFSFHLNIHPNHPSDPIIRIEQKNINFNLGMVEQIREHRGTFLEPFLVTGVNNKDEPVHLVMMKRYEDDSMIQ